MKFEVDLEIVHILRNQGGRGEGLRKCLWFIMGRGHHQFDDISKLNDLKPYSYQKSCPQECFGVGFKLILFRKCLLIFRLKCFQNFLLP